MEEGSDGLTITSVDIGAKTGTIEIDYETFTVKDRMDVFYGNKWVAGTGMSLGKLEPPPSTTCDEADTVDGYVGQDGTCTFEADGSATDVKIYASGCIGNNTKWNFNMQCP